MGLVGRHVALNYRLSVSSAIVQRYMDPILDAALSQHPQTQSAAVDILSFTIKQGLAHPLQSFPVIVALETSPNTALSARASALHSALNSKHASLLNSRYIISARASFSYQAKLAHARGGSGAVEGARGGTALLHRWFALVREKRGPKLEFLKALVRAFDVGTSLVAAQEDIDFARYMAENFAAFDYKTQEEVLLVVKSLTNVLSTAGMQCIEALSPGYLLAQLQAPVGQQPLRTQADSTEAPVPDTTTVDPAEQGSTSFLGLLKDFAHNECSPHSPDARKAPPSSHVCSDRLDHASQSPSKEFVWAHGRVRHTLTRRSSSAFLTEKTNRKCLKWVIGKKNALGDKPATRRGGAAGAPLSWARLPFATQSLLTTADMEAQRDAVCHISIVRTGFYSLSIMPVLGNLARGRGHCRARR
jgi:cohesin loading factor subunit SCC2